MQIETPANASELIAEWREWFLDEHGTPWTRIKATGARTRGVWIICEHCRRTAPAHHYNAKRFCKTACRNAGMVGERAGNWAGGRQSQVNGYIRIQAGRNRRMLEHRYVMEQHLGRPLSRSETVHHKNGDRTDNRIENLELWVGRHPPGASEKHCPTCRCFGE